MSWVRKWSTALRVSLEWLLQLISLSVDKGRSSNVGQLVLLFPLLPPWMLCFILTIKIEVFWLFFAAKIKDNLYVAIKVSHLSSLCFPFTYLSLSVAWNSDLDNLLKAKPELVPSLLTMALNDAITYDKVWSLNGFISLAFGSLRWFRELV